MANITSSDYFTFNVDNSLLLVGQTGTGKSILEDKYLERLIAGHTPEELKFILLDMTGVDFWNIRDNHKEYILEDVQFDAEKGLDILEKFARTVSERIEIGARGPLLVLCIEECDMAVLSQKRFDDALIQINQFARGANVKIIFSTSRPSPEIISPELKASFDLILSGTLADSDYDYLGVQKPRQPGNYEFVVTTKLQEKS